MSSTVSRLPSWVSTPVLFESRISEVSCHELQEVVNALGREWIQAHVAESEGLLNRVTVLLAARGIPFVVKFQLECAVLAKSDLFSSAGVLIPSEFGAAFFCDDTLEELGESLSGNVEERLGRAIEAQLIQRLTNENQFIYLAFAFEYGLKNLIETIKQTMMEQIKNPIFFEDALRFRGANEDFLRKGRRAVFELFMKWGLNFFLDG